MRDLARWIFGFCAVVLLIDLAFFGPGLALPGVPFSIRRVLFLGVLASAAALRLMSRHSVTRPELALIMSTLTLIVGWALIIPFVNGYKLGHAVADVSAWIALLLVALWPWREFHPRLNWESVRRMVLALGLVLACAHILLWLLLVTDVISPTAFYFAAEALFGSDTEGDAYIRIAEASSGYRIFWTSSIFLLGCVYFLIAYGPRRGRASWLLSLLFIFFALWTTQIRAFIGSLVIFVVAWGALRMTMRIRSKFFPRAQVLALWAASIFAVAVAMNPAVLETMGLAREGGSDAERLEQAGPLLDQFLSRPVLGSGFGSYASRVVRSDDAPFSYELTFYALLMKLGILGSLLLGVVFLMALRCVRAEEVAKKNPAAFALWTAFTTGLWFSGATNPMVTNFVGMAVIVLLFIDLRQQLWREAPLDRRDAVTDMDSPAPALQSPLAR